MTRSSSAGWQVKEGFVLKAIFSVRSPVVQCELLSESFRGDGKCLEQAGACSEPQTHSRLQSGVRESVIFPCIPCQCGHNQQHSGMQHALLQAPVCKHFC